MKNRKIIAQLFVGDNDVDGLIPEIWAQEALMILEEDLVIANLVHRDFEDEISEYGDTVNANRPRKFTAKRKAGRENVTTQDAISDKVPVILDQHIHTSFLIHDKDFSLSQQDLINMFLRPAVVSLVEGVERAVGQQLYHFVHQSVGRLGTAPDKTTLNSAKGLANNQLIPNDGQRYMLLSNNTEVALTNEELFISAEKIGDDGTALRAGSLGMKYGWNCVNHSMMPSVSVAAGDTVTGAINNVAGYAAGTTSFTVDNFSAAIANGTYITIAGDDTPLRVTATTGGATPTAITVNTGLKRAVANDAVVTVVKPVLVDNAAGYAAGHVGDIIYDGAGEPIVGQLVGAADNRYGIWEDDGTDELKTNRALDAAVADDAVLGLGPSGDYSFGFHRNALALVNRPLAIPRAPAVNGAVVNYNGLSIRVVFTYDGLAQATRCTADLLCGTKVLDDALGLVLLG